MLFFSGIAAAIDVTKIQWDTGKSGILKRNEVMTFNEYSVQVTGFNAPLNQINISKCQSILSKFC